MRLGSCRLSNIQKYGTILIRHNIYNVMKYIIFLDGSYKRPKIIRIKVEKEDEGNIQYVHFMK